jgi:predicted transposase YbfD/YdcC
LSNLAIVEAFLNRPDARRGEGKRHNQALCLALFTLSICAGCRGFLSISDWLLSYHSELIELFNPAKSRRPSYSTIRSVLLNLDYQAYGNCLAQLFQNIIKGKYLMIKKPHTRYYISSLSETVEQFAKRIRDYWHVENKVHYVPDVTQGEDASRIRVTPLPNIFALTRNFALNLYREDGSKNMAQSQRSASSGIDFLKSLFRMK